MNFNKYHLILFSLGFCGLGSETLYFKILDFAVGSAPLVAFTVVGGFILGIGLGGLFSVRIRRPSYIEALLAIFHGIWALHMPQILKLNTKALEFISPLLGINLASSLVGFLYIVFAAFLLGVTFPIIVERTGHAGRSYLVHAFGAVLGIILVEFWLYPVLGMPATLFILAAVHAINALLLLNVVVGLKTMSLARVYGVLVVLGVLTGSLQGTSLWFAELLFKPYFYIQAIVVAYFVLGLTVGSFLWVRWPFTFTTNIWLCYLGVVISAVFATFWLTMPFSEDRPRVIAELGLILLPSAIPIGALFPAFMRNLPKDRPHAASVLFSLSLGNTLGLLLTGAVFLRFLLPTHALFAIALALFILSRPNKNTLLFASSIPLILLGISTGAFSEKDFIQRIHPDHQVTQVHQVFRGPAEISAVYTYVPSGGTIPARHRRLYQNGYSPVNLDRKTEAVISSVGMSYSSNNGRALVIGAGSGRSAGAVARVFDRVDVIDLGSTVERLLQYLAVDNWGILERDGVRFYRMDGVSAPYLFDKHSFDLIVMTVDPGYLQKSAKLYFLETLDAFKRLLKSQGIFIFWADGKVGNQGAQILVNNGKEVFKYQKLYAVFHSRNRSTADYFLLIHSEKPLIQDYNRLGVLEKLTGDRLVALHGYMCEGDRLIVDRFHPSRRLHSLYHPSFNVLFRAHSGADGIY